MEHYLCARDGHASKLMCSQKRVNTLWNVPNEKKFQHSLHMSFFCGAKLFDFGLLRRYVHTYIHSYIYITHRIHDVHS